RKFLYVHRLFAADRAFLRPFFHKSDTVFLPRRRADKFRYLPHRPFRRRKLPDTEPSLPSGMQMSPSDPREMPSPESLRSPHQFRTEYPPLFSLRPVCSSAPESPRSALRPACSVRYQIQHQIQPCTFPPGFPVLRFLRLPQKSESVSLSLRYN